MGLFKSRLSHPPAPPLFNPTSPQPTTSLLPLPPPLPPPPTLSSAPPIPNDASVVDPNDPLQIAIFYHELNVLEVATYYFSVAAARGHPVGLFMYAMSMRHGWGCGKDEEGAVRLLQKAAETAVMDLNQELDTTQHHHLAPSPTTTPISPTSPLQQQQQQQLAFPSGPLKTIATAELTLAIYELAMSFKQGWGVPKSKTTSTYYMTIAAQLGDVDAQQELGECYLRGDGVKRDKKMAAKWFREAERQGAHMVSMQWIWKEKYDPEPKT
ncbi:hypothetical protein PhCBS80983_g00200 [Powellomyces hirtus]|uniref:HCP-like protein n=1 Tax=Powellomyces hirtus TaxID=109895 RepID=A0A507EGH8_9FUNG|nr:hypothetical protein PhCBS80983_g00200 [Powellomyces hirtus]